MRTDTTGGTDGEESYDYLMFILNIYEKHNLVIPCCGCLRPVRITKDEDVKFQRSYAGRERGTHDWKSSHTGLEYVWVVHNHILVQRR